MTKELEEAGYETEVELEAGEWEMEYERYQRALERSDVSSSHFTFAEWLAAEETTDL